MFEKETLFGFPIYKIKVDPELFDKDKIVDDISKNYEKNPNRNQLITSETRFHHGYGDMNNDGFIKIDYTRLESVYNKILNEFFNKTYSSAKRFNYEFNIINYTASKSDQGLCDHSHLPESFSCIHYLKFDKHKHRPVVFQNPGAYPKYAELIVPQEIQNMRKDATNSYMMNSWSPDVGENDLIIFPSSLEHRVPTQTSDDLRISIATNITMT